MNSSALKAENERLHFLFPSSQLELPFTPWFELNDLQIYFTQVIPKFSIQAHIFKDTATLEVFPLLATSFCQLVAEQNINKLSVQCQRKKSMEKKGKTNEEQKAE